MKLLLAATVATTACSGAHASLSNHVDARPRIAACAESRLRATLNDPGLLRAGPLELVPVQTPSFGRWSIDLFESLTTEIGRAHV